MKRLIAILFILGFAPLSVLADTDTAPWDVNNPSEETRPIALDVTEGTWMSLDVSPDGKTIAFDLLGDIYTLPITGGDATPIASGMAWEIQPRFSPDGTRIAFTSDRDGANNLWVMAPDGSDKTQVSRETFRLVNNPTWSADGRFLAARKHFTTERSLGTGEIWLYHVSGGTGTQLIARPSEAFQKELGEPMFSPDGRSLYYAMNTTPGSRFIYAQDSNGQIFEIIRYDMETGATEAAVSGPGGAVRPTPSPDGTKIAFVRRVRAQSALFVKDLRSGEERQLYDGLDQDMQETWAIHGLYPNMDWMPDSNSILVWAGGKIRRVDAATGAVSTIPFRVRDTRAVIDPPRPEITVAPETFDTTMVRFAAVSPNGASAVFESLGKLYVKSLPQGTPRRLTRTSDDTFEMFPAWSRDGRSIAYVSWTDEALGTVMRIRASGGRGTAVTQEPGHYRRPQFSPDGRQIVFEKGTGGYLTDGRWSEAPGVYIVDAKGGSARRVTADGSHPHFGADADRLFLTRDGADGQSLVSIDLNGSADRVHATADLAHRFKMAPSERHIVFQENYQVYAMPVPMGGPTASPRSTPWTMHENMSAG